ncbi:hypothetical protein AB0J40_23680 [Amycolatopsis sp. NPDC049691]|uniref:hypothetical protein n=1 Tax=Amycolatopsis sp. NPDC049691 TaxID=3155155 RepID=UPI00343508BE
MRGDWIYDWVRVEMEYRAGPPHPVRRRREPRQWTALWAALFSGRRIEVRHSGSPANC